MRKKTKPQFKGTLLETILDGLDKNRWGAEQERAMLLSNAAPQLARALGYVLRNCLIDDRAHDVITNALAATEPAKAGKSNPDQVIREFPPVERYRIRVLHDLKTGSKSLDIREYLTSETFEGFTRRGIRLTRKADIQLLRDILDEIGERAIIDGFEA